MHESIKARVYADLCNKGGNDPAQVYVVWPWMFRGVPTTACAGGLFVRRRPRRASGRWSVSRVDSYAASSYRSCWGSRLQKRASCSSWVKAKRGRRLAPDDVKEGGK